MSFRRSLWPRSRGVGMLLLVFLVLSLAPIQARRASAGSIADYKPGEVVVKLAPASGATVNDINTAYGTQTKGPVDAGSGDFVLQAPAGQDAQTLAAAMSTDPRLLYAEPNFVGQAPEANPGGIGGWGGPDPAPFQTQYAADLLGLRLAQAITRGAGSVVAVLDTGVELAHPALAANLTAAGYDYIDKDTVPDDTGVGPVVGHGTHVAGIVHLVAPDAQIMPLRVLGPDGRGDVVSVAAAIFYAAHHGANVINLSLGTPAYSKLLSDAIRDATRSGAVVIGSAGNTNTSIAQYPAADNCTLAVTAIGPDSIKSSYANYGQWVDIAAPGDAIYSMFPPDGYAWWSGTSMAAPFIAGQAALIHSLAPAANAMKVAQLIGGTAHPLDSLNPTYAGLLGQGRTDIGASISSLAAGIWPTSTRSKIGDTCVE